jgi:hypothetical protein
LFDVLSRLVVFGLWTWFPLKKLDRTFVFLISPSNKNHGKAFTAGKLKFPDGAIIVRKIEKTIRKNEI